MRSCGPPVSGLIQGDEDVGPEFGAGDCAVGGSLDANRTLRRDVATPRFPLGNKRGRDAKRLCKRSVSKFIKIGDQVHA